MQQRRYGSRGNPSTLEVTAKPQGASAAYALPAEQFWTIRSREIGRSRPRASADAPPVTMATVDVSDVVPPERPFAVVGVFADRLLLTTDGSLVVAAFSEGRIAVTAVALPPENGESRGAPVAAGPLLNGEGFWAAWPHALRVLEPASAQGPTETGPRWRTLSAGAGGLGEPFSALGIALASGEAFEAQGLVIGIANGGFVIGQNRFSKPGQAADPAAVWETQAKPVATQFCAGCHGENGIGGWSGAQTREAWTGDMKDRILQRVEGKTMPPIGSVQEKDLTPEARAMLLAWLKSEK